MIATLCFSGLRIGEMLSLRWRDVDLVGGWLTVAESKTPTGRRRGQDPRRSARRAPLGQLTERAWARGLRVPDGYRAPTRTRQLPQSRPRPGGQTGERKAGHERRSARKPV